MRGRDADVLGLMKTGMNRKKTYHICPRCKGTGFARGYNKTSKYSDEIREKAEFLYQIGMTYRQVAKELNIKHPQTVKNLFRKIK